MCPIDPLLVNPEAADVAADITTGPAEDTDRRRRSLVERP
jgi:hypothetical protein